MGFSRAAAPAQGCCFAPHILLFSISHSPSRARQHPTFLINFPKSISISISPYHVTCDPHPHLIPSHLDTSNVPPYNVLPEHLLQARKSQHKTPSPRVTAPTKKNLNDMTMTPRTNETKDRRRQRPARVTSATSRRPSASPRRTRSTFSTRARRTSPTPDSPPSSSSIPPPP